MSMKNRMGGLTNTRISLAAAAAGVVLAHVIGWWSLLLAMFLAGVLAREESFIGESSKPRFFNAFMVLSAWGTSGFLLHAVLPGFGLVFKGAGWAVMNPLEAIENLIFIVTGVALGGAMTAGAVALYIVASMVGIAIICAPFWLVAKVFSWLKSIKNEQ